MAQVAINWSCSKGVIPLVGVRSVSQAEDAVLATSWKLSPSEVKELDALALDKGTFEKGKVRRFFAMMIVTMIVVGFRVSRLLTAVGILKRPIY